MIQLFDCQEKAIHKLKQLTDELLDFQGNKTIVFKAPTGSGKTVMMAEFLKELVEHRPDQKTFAFIWAAPRQLHEQSKARLEKHYADTKALRCVSFEDLIDRQIHQNEILFLNWESINKKDNIYIRENEREMNLSTIMQNTRDAGLIVILVIDESHFASKSEISRGLVEMFSPKVTIEVSATPNLQGDESVTVYPEQVISEGMIKKLVAINPGFKNIITQQKDNILTITSEAAESTDEFVLRMAIEKRVQLAQGFQAIGSNVNPLLLIQLPDKRQGEEDLKDDVIQILKRNHNITLENGKLAIYLSENKANLENITRNDSEAEVMIFKQAIALGWDCPRASILVLFRNWQSFTFSTQTLGRILRMPELMHYENDELNIGYVFTNLGDLSILEDTAGAYLTIQYAKRADDYKEIKLHSAHTKRHREETRLSPQFIRDFLTAANELNLKEKIKQDVNEVNLTLLADGIVENIDLHPEHIAESTETIRREQNVMEIQKIFNMFILDNLTPFFPESRSVGRVKEAIYRFLQIIFPFEYEYGGVKAQKLVLGPENCQYFIDTIDLAKQIYHLGIDKQHKEIITADWDVPTSRNFNNQFSQRPMNKSVMQPYYEAANASQPEIEFAAFLNGTLNGIEWFYRNGESDATAFAIPYSNSQGEETLFYLDWIVKFADGHIGLFDTKSGITAETAKTRAEGLAAYIKSENEKGKNLFGGIIIKKDGSWMYNDNEQYEYNLNDLSLWKYLS
jgi:type III restriction enzyme